MSLDQIIQNRIEEEAFLHYKNNARKDALQNWSEAQNEILDRIRFIAYYLHVNNINRSALENWLDAEEIYLNNF